MVFVAAFVVGIGLSVSPGAQKPSVLESVRKLTFATPLAEFVRAAEDPQRDPRLVWESDGCSAPVLGNAGKTYDFTFACRRHDFGYRNLKRIDSGKHWDEKTREKVDKVFLADMRAGCDVRPAAQRKICRSWANVYYSAVRRLSD